MQDDSFFYKKPPIKIAISNNDALTNTNAKKAEQNIVEELKHDDELIVNR